MQVIEVPQMNPDGTVQAVVKIHANEAQVLLQFALNFLTAQGITVTEVMQQAEKMKAEIKVGLND